MVENINISLDNLGTINKNCVIIKTNLGSVDLYFSYKTLVAVNNKVSVNDWGNTTGKLLNELEADKSKRIEHGEVLKEMEKALKELFFTEKELLTQNL